MKLKRSKVMALMESMRELAEIGDMDEDGYRWGMWIEIRIWAERRELRIPR